MIEVKDTDWAYAAGFVDGEGCIAIARSFEPTRGRFYYSVQVVITNRDRSVLEWFQRIWGGWLVPGPKPAPGSKARESWNWRAPTGQSAEPFLVGIGEHLKIKMAQCENALAMIQLSRRSHRTLGPNPIPADWLSEQEALYWKQRELNHRGSQAFARQAMHSPRKISRARLSAS